MIVYHTQIDSATDTEYKNKWERWACRYCHTMWNSQSEIPKTRRESVLLLTSSGRDVLKNFAFFRALAMLAKLFVLSFRLHSYILFAKTPLWSTSSKKLTFFLHAMMVLPKLSLSCRPEPISSVTGSWSSHLPFSLNPDSTPYFQLMDDRKMPAAFCWLRVIYYDTSKMMLSMSLALENLTAMAMMMRPWICSRGWSSG